MKLCEKFSFKSTHKFAFCGFLYTEIIQLKNNFVHGIFYLLEEGILFSLQGLLLLSKYNRQLLISSNEK